MVSNKPDSTLVIFSDSAALVGDIEYVFRDRLDVVSSDSLEWVKDYIHRNRVKLVIADMDDRIAVQKDFLNELRAFGDQNTALLFLVSERKKLELEKTFGNLSDLEVSAGWLTKPFSRNSLISSVDRLSL